MEVRGGGFGVGYWVLGAGEGGGSIGYAGKGLEIDGTRNPSYVCTLRYAGIPFCSVSIVVRLLILENCNIALNGRDFLSVPSLSNP